MLKRLSLVGLFTGAGQLFSIFVLKLVSQKTNPGILAHLGQFDSYYQFILNIIALGLQSAAMRDIAISANWQADYFRAQSARLMLSLLLLPVSLLAFGNPVYAIFLITPLLALSGDYALYALGHPVIGALVAFFRVLIPYGLIALAVLIRPFLAGYAYFAGLFLSFMMTDIYIAYVLKTPFIFAPRWKNIFLYVKNIPLGLVTLSLYFIGMGVLLIMPYFYPANMVAVAFVGLKFYLIFKGVLRIIQQYFVKDMLKDTVCLQVDQLSMIGGLMFLGSILVFPASFITMFFGRPYMEYKIFFQVLGICALVYSFALSLTTRAMLEKKDRSYTIVSMTAASLCLLLVILYSFVAKNVIYIAVSILTGEVFFLAGMLFIMKGKRLLIERASFLVRNSVFLAIPLIIRYFAGDSVYAYISGLVCFALVLLLVHRGKFVSVK